MINICVIGNKGVGKSTWIEKWSKTGYSKDIKFTNLDEAQVVFLMFDVTDLQSYRDNILWLNFIRETTCPKIPICLIGNKIEVKKRVVLSKIIKFHLKHGLIYYEMSALSGYNLEKPLEWAQNGGRIPNFVDDDMFNQSF